MNIARLDVFNKKYVASSTPRPEATDLQRIKRGILMQYPFYHNSTEFMQEKISNAATYNALETGDYLFNQHDACERVFLVGSGHIRLYARMDTGREITLYHVGPGEICPINILCVLIGGLESVTAQVVSDAETVMLPAAAFRKWLAEEDTVRYFAFQSLKSRFSSVISLVGDIAFRKMHERLASYLRSRFRDGGENPSTLHLTHEQIAMELGSAREVISRILKNFEQHGAIKLGRGSIRLIDEASLQTMAGDANS